MNYQDSLKVGEMAEGQKYACTQQGHGYSSGVWMTKNGNEIELRHFWEENAVPQNDNGYYFYDETDKVYYPSNPKDDQKDIIHADIMSVIPDAITYDFEEMTLADFYDIVSMGIYHLTSEEHVFPKHAKDMRKVYSRDGEFLYGLNLSA